MPAEFMRLNDLDLAASKEEKYRAFLALASGELSEPELAAWIRRRLERADG